MIGGSGVRMTSFEELQRIRRASRRSEGETASVVSRAVCIPGIHIHFIFLTGGENPGDAKGGGGSYKLPQEYELASSRVVDCSESFYGFESSYKLPPTVRPLAFSENCFFCTCSAV